MNSRKTLAAALAVLAIFSLVVFVASISVTGTPLNLVSGLSLAVIVLAGTAAFLAALNDIEQLVARHWPGGAAAVWPKRAFKQYHERLARDLADDYHLDDQFVRLTLQKIDDRQEADGERGRYKDLSKLLTDIDERAVVLLGDPGAGKTTLLRRLQWEKARAELQKSNQRTTFLVSLNTYRGRQRGDPPPEPGEWLAEQWRIQNPALPDFHLLFQEGRFHLLLDGLNEMPHVDDEEYRWLVGRWKTFLRQTARCDNTVIFSCRTLFSALLDSEENPVRYVRVEPLAPEQIEEFLIRHLQQSGAGIYQNEIRHDEKQLELYATPFFLRLLVEQIGEDGRMPSGRAGLLTGFVRQALQREVDRGENHLFDAGVLLSKEDWRQVAHKAWPLDRPYHLPTGGPLFPRLALLAFRMQDNRESGDMGAVSVPAQIGRDYVDHEWAEQIIDAGVQLNVLDKNIEKQETKFYHQLLQEYFAARVFKDQPQPERLRSPWLAEAISPSLADVRATLTVNDPLPPLPATGWEETALLAAAMTAGQEAFVRGLLEAHLPLAARCAASLEVTVSSKLVSELQRRLIARIENEEAELRARIDAAEALAELGDPRFVREIGAFGAYLFPPLQPIPGGTYTIGDDDSAWDDEKPAHPVEIAPFEMGVFPVTNAEYRLFINAGGYEDETWWQTAAARAWLRGETTAEGQQQEYRDLHESLQGVPEDDIRGRQWTDEDKEWDLWFRSLDAQALEATLERWFAAGTIYRKPRYWDDSRFNHRARPVVGVSWFEARAYCAWLSAQSGDHFDLPTEAEWEAAARGREGRAYAFEGPYDPGRCNTFETQVRRTTPVGVFPRGRTPAGIADLSGNVWEWTTTIWGSKPLQPDYGYPYQADGREDVHNPDARRILRGGSWNSIRVSARAAFRFNYNPFFRDAYGGLRVVRRLPSP